LNRWARQEGTPAPLGVSRAPEDGAYNFALYSKHASGVRLLLYGAADAVAPVHVQDFDPRINKSGRVWHCRVPAAIVEASAYYAYQVDGPFDPAAGQRFDPQKILLDPYARGVFFPPQFSREAARQRGANAGRAPLGILHPPDAPTIPFDRRRPSHTHDAIIYELHVRGFTRRASSGVAPERRGTFLGVVDRIPYLKELGVTVIELMPVFQFDPQEGNYWGYMPISFFALHHTCGCEHARGEQIGEFGQLVEALHAADIELVLDVVYNHTGEGDETGPTYSYRAIDNTTYYLLTADGRYRNDSGTGNVVHAANRYVAGMVLDSLHYWAGSFGIDGFRFDLASLFTRASDGSINLDNPPVIDAIQSHPRLSRLRMIAEAWDAASYQLGRTFPGVTWLQWNGAFRDDVRAFVRGDPGLVERLMRRLAGSDDIFPDDQMDAYHAYQSVNFVTCHDGFCLYDLVAYDRKHNEANGEANRDGSDNNLSWNCGWEGDTGVPAAVAALRQRQARNLFCLLMLANGTPMFAAGDEFLNTQGGNNNPYNQDNETTWLDWGRLERNRAFFRFCKLMIAFRKAHPSLGRSRHWRQDVRWHGASGAVDIAASSRGLAFCLHGASQGDVDLYAMINAGPDERAFAIQEEAPGGWRRVIDTALDSPHDIAASQAEMPRVSGGYRVQGRSVVVLVQAAPAAPVTAKAEASSAGG
jgi:glycogen operon protein